jgi:hypothetical protein
VLKGKGVGVMSTITPRPRRPGPTIDHPRVLQLESNGYGVYSPRPGPTTDRPVITNACGVRGQVGESRLWCQRVVVVMLEIKGYGVRE